MENPHLIERLALHRGLGDHFLNYRGETEAIPLERKARLLETLGYDLSDPAALEAAIFQLEAEPWTHLLRPVQVVGQGTGCGVAVHLTEAELVRPLFWQVRLEDGRPGPAGTRAAGSLEETGEYWIGEIRYVRRFLPLPETLVLGYHSLQLTLGCADESGDQGRTGRCRLIMVPRQAYENPDMAAGARLWGTAIQLYTLRSERNWGMGDFTDLAELLREMGAGGAGFIGLNPVHALYPANPERASPYNPSNRSFLNPLYVDPEQTPEFQLSLSVQAQVASPAFQDELKALRASDRVQYGPAGRLKFQVLRQLYDTFCFHQLGQNTDREQAFEAFRAEAGAPLREHAVFEALLAHRQAEDPGAWGWPAWPEAWQDHRSPEVEAFVRTHESDVLYYEYLQFLADEQLRAVSALATPAGMTLGLYRDLAVGADPGGAEVWSNREMYCTAASVGAPPDALAPTGQNWGLPPFDPVRLEARGYEAFITLVRNNMRGCSALRIDHAMSLFRLWWCPLGEDASQGAYIHYNLDHLLGILCLESQRQQCMVIAEDLGTVPAEVETRFPAAHLYSSKVFYFETSAVGTTPPKAYAAKSLALVANHDMPTLCAFWNLSDLALRARLGMFPSAAAEAEEYAGRRAGKARILEALAQAGRLPEGLSQDPEQVPEMTIGLAQAIHCFLGSGSAQLVSVQLEDLLLIKDPVNVPGTSDEYPNWQRKLTRTTRDLFRAPETRRFVEGMTRARQSPE